MTKGTNVLVTTAPPSVRKLKGSRCYQGTCGEFNGDLVTVHFKNGCHRQYHKSWLTELKGDNEDNDNLRNVTGI